MKDKINGQKLIEIIADSLAANEVLLTEVANSVLDANVKHLSNFEFEIEWHTN